MTWEERVRRELEGVGAAGVRLKVLSMDLGAGGEDKDLHIRMTRVC